MHTEMVAVDTADNDKKRTIEATDAPQQKISSTCIGSAVEVTIE